MDHPFTLPIDQVIDHFKSSTEGLSSEEAQKRLETEGPNEIPEKDRSSLLKIFLAQFLNPLVAILFLAALLKFWVASTLDGSVILGTLVFMICIAFFQEAKAEKAMRALKDLSSPEAKLLRGKVVEKKSSKECVPGDILILEAGDSIVADARLLEVSNFQVNEASLTGESLPIEKTINPFPVETPLAERKNMVYGGTVVSHGKAKALVTATGLESELGKIAEQLQQTKKKLTPLQKSIKKLGHWMLLIISLIVVGFVAIGLSLGIGWVELFLLCIAIAVAAIPEGLPATVTVVLASGVHTISKKKGIIRKLVAVETLGSTNTICTDKTGTLTLNKMSLAEVSTFKETYLLEKGSSQDPDFTRVLEIGGLCNNAHMDGGEEKAVGDPTEIAIAAALPLIGMNKKDLEEKHPRQKEIPFSSENQWMATLNTFENETVACIKGAPEKLIEAAAHIQEGGNPRPLTEEDRKSIGTLIKEKAQKGLRVLAVAYKTSTSEEFHSDSLLQNLTFVGLLGMIDPPREEVKEALKKCDQAGITVKMVTGDNTLTAKAIADQLGLKGEKALSGREIETLDNPSLQEAVLNTNVFARIEPLHKLKIVQACKSLNQVVGMTGDGVNDAPALEAADIGISMGITGTDVAKEASDIILTDDNFATIVDCIEEGRSIFNRLRHSASFLLTTCFGEVVTILLSFIFFKLSPLEPLQILWINLITGSLIAIPIGMEGKQGDELTKPPRNPKVGLIHRGTVFRIAYLSSILSLGAFLIFSYALKTSDLTHARSMTFCTIILYEWFVAFQMRSDEHSILKMGLFKNRTLNLTGGVALVLLLLILYIPTLQRSFMTSFLTLGDWALCILPGLSIFLIESLRKKIAPTLFTR